MALICFFLSATDTVRPVDFCEHGGDSQRWASLFEGRFLVLVSGAETSLCEDVQDVRVLFQFDGDRSGRFRRCWPLTVKERWDLLILQVGSTIYGLIDEINFVMACAKQIGFFEFVVASFLGPPWGCHGAIVSGLGFRPMVMRWSTVMWLSALKFGRGDAMGCG